MLSRRINQEYRLVYKINNKAIIIQCRYQLLTPVFFILYHISYARFKLSSYIFILS